MITLLNFVAFWWPWAVIVALILVFDWLATRGEWDKPPKDGKQ